MTSPASPLPSVELDISPIEDIATDPAEIVTVPASPPLPRAEEANTPLSGPIIVSVPEVLIATLPPRPLPPVELVIVPPSVRSTDPAETKIVPACPFANAVLEMSPPCVIVSEPADTVRLPALPPLPNATIPLPVPEMVNALAMVIAVSPARPLPTVELLINAPAVTLNVFAVSIMSPAFPVPSVELFSAAACVTRTEPAATVMLPTFPVLAAPPEALMPVSSPESVRDPGALIAIIPPPPLPFVELLINPPADTRTSLAAIVTLPALPLAEVRLKISPFCVTSSEPAEIPTLPEFPVLAWNVMVAIELGLPETINEPAALTVTSPALPLPDVVLPIDPPSVRPTWLAVIATLPALP